MTIKFCIPKEKHIVADFIAEIKPQEKNAIVVLKNKSLNAESFEWFFPNGTPKKSNQKEPTVTFSKKGMQSLKLIAYNKTKADIKIIKITI